MTKLKKAIRLMAQQEDVKAVGERLGVDFSKIDFEEFEKGYAIELEHGSKDPETNITEDDPELTAKIAWAHLKELPNYYTLLAEMEEKAKRKNVREEEVSEEPREELPEY